jgi:hypothetical protein
LNRIILEWSFSVDNDFLTGTWIYRSFRNDPNKVKDLNTLLVGEAEVTFEAYAEAGQVRGQMAFRSDPPDKNDARLELFGSVQNGNPFSIHILDTGVPGTEAEGWLYEQVGYYIPAWPSGIDQRPAIVGMVTRRVPHGDPKVHPAGFVGSFIAVKRDVPEPREVIPIEASTLAMLATREHRLHHAVWHAVRNSWPGLSEKKKDAIRLLGWGPGPANHERPAEQFRIPYVSNGSGEDFLFMHRQMITMVREMYESAGIAPIGSWKVIPPPGQVSMEPDYSAKPVKLPPPGNPDGFAVMPNWAEPGMEDDARRQGAVKSDSYYWSHMFPASQKFQDSVYLATLTLSALGALIEWTIHNDMHMRWTSEPEDPITGAKVPSGRDALDLDPKWDSPNYDSLSEPYSSLANPVFWRLHGWIDERIDDWFAAHEAVHPGEVHRHDHGGVRWFKKGKWVLLDSPWAKPPGRLDVATMEKVNYIVFSPESASLSFEGANWRIPGVRAGRRVQWFGRVSS